MFFISTICVFNTSSLCLRLSICLLNFKIISLFILIVSTLWVCSFCMLLSIFANSSLYSSLSLLSKFPVIHFIIVSRLFIMPLLLLWFFMTFILSVNLIQINSKIFTCLFSVFAYITFPLMYSINFTLCHYFWVF